MLPASWSQQIVFGASTPRYSRTSQFYFYFLYARKSKYLKGVNPDATVVVTAAHLAKSLKILTPQSEQDCGRTELIICPGTFFLLSVSV